MARLTEKELKVLLKMWGLYAGYQKYADYFNNLADIICKRLKVPFSGQLTEDQCAEALSLSLTSFKAWLKLASNSGLDNVKPAVASGLRQQFSRFLIIQRRHRLGIT